MIGNRESFYFLIKRHLQILLGLAGLFNIGMAFSSAVALCSLAGISYGPVHTSLPFLLMGLGIKICSQFTLVCFKLFSY